MFSDFMTTKMPEQTVEFYPHHLSGNCKALQSINFKIRSVQQKKHLFRSAFSLNFIEITIRQE